VIGAISASYGWKPDWIFRARLEVEHLEQAAVTGVDGTASS
jgi:hypothetical protein